MNTKNISIKEKRQNTLNNEKLFLTWFNDGQKFDAVKINRSFYGFYTILPGLHKYIGKKILKNASEFFIAPRNGDGQRRLELYVMDNYIKYTFAYIEQEDNHYVYKSVNEESKSIYGWFRDCVKVDCEYLPGFEYNHTEWGVVGSSDDENNKIRYWDITLSAGEEIPQIRELIEFVLKESRENNITSEIEQNNIELLNIDRKQNFKMAWGNFKNLLWKFSSMYKIIEVNKFWNKLTQEKYLKDNRMSKYSYNTIPDVKYFNKLVMDNLDLRLFSDRLNNIWYNYNVQIQKPSFSFNVKFENIYEIITAWSTALISMLEVAAERFKGLGRILSDECFIKRQKINGKNANVETSNIKNDQAYPSLLLRKSKSLPDQADLFFPLFQKEQGEMTNVFFVRLPYYVTYDKETNEKYYFYYEFNFMTRDKFAEVVLTDK